MKKLLLLALCLNLNIAYAQLRPPVQVDTLKVNSVKYNYTQIKRENWICTEIYKSTTEFVFGDSKFNIISVKEGGYDGSYKAKEFIYNLEDGNELLLYEDYYTSKKTVVFSGYEFTCNEPENNKYIRIQNQINCHTTPHVIGRSTVGSVPIPTSTLSVESIVVVDIWVDKYGNVKKAEINNRGTVTTDETLLKSACNAAMNTHFNVEANAAKLQKGSIRYVFKMNSK